MASVLRQGGRSSHLPGQPGVHGSGKQPSSPILILSGELRDGDRLPGENAIMAEYSIARATARQALQRPNGQAILVLLTFPGAYALILSFVLPSLRSAWRSRTAAPRLGHSLGTR